ncbi:MAG: pyruvate kinase [Solirubrobacteraceae bacterium]
MRRTKIVATIGPASRAPEVLTRMVQAGLDVARLDFSHGSRETHAQDAERIRAAAAQAGRPVAILLDLPRPRLRVGALQGGFVELKPSERLVLLGGSSEEGNERQMSVGWAGLADNLALNDHVYVGDGAVRLRVTAVRAAAGEVETVVELGGAVASGQGLNIPGSSGGPDAVAEDDLELVRFGEQIGVDGIALSLVQSAEDVQKVRQHTRVPLVAKIEKPRAVEAAEEIIRTADCVMVARSDLGVELPIEDVPIAQKRLLRIAGHHARLSITATQMLDSMVTSPRPSRAEAADVANAILDGTDAVMLSQETAIGAYPVDSVAMMASIAERTEHSLPYKLWNDERVQRDLRDPSYTIAFSACAAARDLHVAALVVPTLSGRSARLISAHRPQVPILALSPGKETVQRCGFMWGVQAASMPRHESFETLIAATARRVVELGWVKPGARVAITAGLGGHAGTTLLQIQRV